MHFAIFVMNIFICGSYSRAVSIFANSRSLRRLFKGGYYLKCSIYSRKYGIYRNFCGKNFFGEWMKFAGVKLLRDKIYFGNFHEFALVCEKNFSLRKYHTCKLHN